jgi:hypothetical protein
LGLRLAEIVDLFGNGDRVRQLLGGVLFHFGHGHTPRPLSVCE